MTKSQFYERFSDRIASDPLFSFTARAMDDGGDLDECVLVLVDLLAQDREGLLDLIKMHLEYCAQPVPVQVKEASYGKEKTTEVGA